MKFVHVANRIYANDESGRLLAEVTFPAVGPDEVEIDHTFVDPSLRGGGVASRLMEEAYEEIRRQGKRARATCPYAVRWFEKHAEKRDILAS
jgi:Predicted acetyltransferase